MRGKSNPENAVYKELRKLEKIREQDENSNKQRECNFFNSKKEAIEFSEKLKKAHGISYIGPNSREDRIEAYFRGIYELTGFIANEDSIVLEDRLMALEALRITEQKLVMEFRREFSLKDMDKYQKLLEKYNYTTGETINKVFKPHKEFFKEGMVEEAFNQINYWYDKLTDYYNIHSLDDL